MTAQLARQVRAGGGRRLRRAIALCCRALCLLAGLLLGSAAAQAQALELSPTLTPTIQARLTLIQGTAASIDLQALRRAQDEGRLRSPPPSQVLSFGIGAAPVGLRLAIDNHSATPLAVRLLVGTSWLDRLWLDQLQDGALAHQARAGDEWTEPELKAARLEPALGWTLPLSLPPGASELYLRVISDDPLVLPLQLVSEVELDARQRQMDTLYGFLYGVLAALCGYNLMLYVGLRDRNYLNYSIYLLSVIALNLAYTGHGLAWLWPGEIMVQRYVILVLMLLVSVCGLWFADRFLALAEHAPRALAVSRALQGVALLAMGVSVALDQHVAAAYVAFFSVAFYSLGMVLLGLQAARQGRAEGRIFTVAALCGMAGAAITNFTVWGFLPFLPLTFHAFELGIVVEATLLAQAVSHRVREHQRESQLATQLAHLDPLTGLHNRRAFFEFAKLPWSAAMRKARPLSMVTLDLDHFKKLNDAHGHEAGDQALVAVAEQLRNACRAGDVLARWGGEEFLLLLPETDQVEAKALAERLRERVLGIELTVRDGVVCLSGSFGVAQFQPGMSLDELIRAADLDLLAAKRMGRNRVGGDSSA